MNDTIASDYKCDNAYHLSVEDGAEWNDLEHGTKWTEQKDKDKKNAFAKGYTLRDGIGVIGT